MDEPGPTPTRVLAIGGWGRCGSTLLDMMLGQLEGFVSAGEIRELWLRGCQEDRPCSCGEPFSGCEFWSQVGQAAFGGWSRLDLDRVLRVRYRRDRAWGLPGLLAGRRSPDPDLGFYLAVLRDLLAGIAEVAGGAIVVDSSKLPTHNLLLRQCPGLDLSMVHLVRDSRGVAYSVQKHVTKSVTRGEATTLPRHGALASSLRYDLYNGAYHLMELRDRRDRETARRMLRVRYEDLVQDPRHWVAAIARLADPSVSTEMPFLSDAGDAVTLAPHHLVDGNPVRFARGPLPLRVDGAWRDGLAVRDRRVVGVLTSPLLAGYGYGVTRDGDRATTRATTSAA